MISWVVPKTHTHTQQPTTNEPNDCEAAVNLNSLHHNLQHLPRQSINTDNHIDPPTKPLSTWWVVTLVQSKGLLSSRSSCPVSAVDISARLLTELGADVADPGPGAFQYPGPGPPKKVAAPDPYPGGTLGIANWKTQPLHQTIPPTLNLHSHMGITARTQSQPAHHNQCCQSTQTPIQVQEVDHDVPRLASNEPQTSMNPTARKNAR